VKTRGKKGFGRGGRHDSAVPNENSNAAFEIRETKVRDVAKHGKHRECAEKVLTLKGSKVVG